MANELTRKGIAFGAAVALGSTLMAGGAANAALNVNYQDLTIELADDGLSNGVMAALVEDTIDFETNYNNDVEGNDLVNLKYKVTVVDDTEEGEGYADFSFDYFSSYDAYEDLPYQDEYTYEFWEDGGEDFVFDAPAALVGNDTNGTCVDFVEETFDTDWCREYSATGVYEIVADEFGGTIIHDDYGSYTGPDTIGFSIFAEDVDGDADVYIVQAFIDSNDNGVIGDNESHSAPVTVTFYDDFGLTPVLSYLEDDGVVYAEESVTSGSIDYEITFAEPLNDMFTDIYTIDEDFGAISEYDMGENGGDTDYADSDWTEDSDYDYDLYQDEDGYFEDYYWDEDRNLVGYGSIDWDTLDNGNNRGSTVRVAAQSSEDGPIGDWTYLEFRDAEVDEVDSYVVEQDYVAANGNGADIRDDVQAVEYVVEFQSYGEDNLDDNMTEDDEFVSGVDATVYSYFYGTAEDLEAYGLEVNGEAPVETEDGSEVWEWVTEGTSNADGQVVIDITATNPDDVLYVEVQSVEYEANGAYLGADLNWNPTSFTVEFDSNIYDGDTFKAEVGGSFDFDVYVVDRWGHAPDGDVRIQWYSEDRDGWDYKYADVNSSGVADVSLNDDDAAAGEASDQRYYINELQVKNGSGWDDDISWDGDNDLYINWVEDDLSVDYVTAEFTEEDGQAGIAHGDFFSGNSLFADWDEDAYSAAMGWDEADNGDYEWLEGDIHAAGGQYVDGAVVTISGQGLMFDDYYGERVAPNSITIRADDNGYYGVYVSAHKVGEHTVTITSGGKSTTATLLIDDRNLYASAVAVSPFTGKAGTSEMITATVTDKWGNLVPETDVTFSVTGGGYFVEDVDTTEGDSLDNAIEDVAEAGYGQASEMLVVMSNEVGYGMTVTATVDVVDPLEVADETTASGSLAAGATNSGKPAFWTKDIGNGEVKLYAKNIVGAGKITFHHNGKEVAWINAVDALNPKLRAANGSYYLVRTLKLVSGKNVFEIKDDGERVVRRVASK